MRRPSTSLLIVMMFVLSLVAPIPSAAQAKPEKAAPSAVAKPSLGDFDDFVNQALKDWKVPGVGTESIGSYSSARLRSLVLRFAIPTSARGPLRMKTSPTTPFWGPIGLTASEGVCPNAITSGLATIHELDLVPDPSPYGYGPDVGVRDRSEKYPAATSFFRRGSRSVPRYSSRKSSST
jgi:hypothetical protein